MIQWLVPQIDIFLSLKMGEDNKEEENVNIVTRVQGVSTRSEEELKQKLMN